jgi:N-acetylmuramoyl-L-alanine amidase
MMISSRRREGADPLNAEAVNKTSILGKAQADPSQMQAYLKTVNPQAPNYSRLYINIGLKYGVRGDLAFAQAMKETGYWRFGGSVKASQNNFAGLGAVNKETGGASFSSPEQGIEAQIQHLYGYATQEPLPRGVQVVDPRWSILVDSGLRGSAPYWEDLNGKWAVPGNRYGQEIIQIWQKILEMPSKVPSISWKTEAINWLESEALITSEHDADSPVTWAELGVVLNRLKQSVDKTR